MDQRGDEMSRDGTRVENIFYDSDARALLQEIYPVHNSIERKLIKTIHRSGYGKEQIDCVIYSLVGSPAKGTLMLSLVGNKIKTMRLFTSYGKFLKKYNVKYYDHEIEETKTFKEMR